MQNPSGQECAYYYEDFARGADRQECRAPIDERGARWRPADCTRCPVPGILVANGSPYLALRITIRPGLIGLGRRIYAEARCSLHEVVIEDPLAGCHSCNREADELLKTVLD